MKTPEERIIRGTGNFIHCTDYEDAIQAMKEYAIDYHESEVKKLHLQNVNGSAFVIMYQKKPLKNILFPSCDEARNYIKMQHPKRTFKEPKENVFVCSRYGTTFEIVELHYR
jgi:hypothetical protein